LHSFVSGSAAPSTRRLHFFVVSLIFHRAYPASLIRSRCRLATFGPFILLQVTVYIAVNRHHSIVASFSSQ
jgi:hypothetical protein